MSAIIKIILSDPKVRRALGQAVAAILGSLFLIIYGIMSSPWALLSSFFQTGGDEPNWDELFAFDTRESYVAEFDNFAGNPNNDPPKPSSYMGIIKPVYDSNIATVQTSLQNTADRMKDNSSQENKSSYAIVYFDEINPDGTLNLDPNEAGIIVSMYNNVGYKWDWYQENAPEILQEMNVPKNEDGIFIGELSSVDMSKLLNLIKHNKNKFFKLHIPNDSGMCSLGAACTLGHNETGGIHEIIHSSYLDDDLDDDSTCTTVPKTYQELRFSGLEAPQFGLYYSEWEEPVDTDGDGEDDDIATYGEYLAVGYVEYNPFQFFEERLHATPEDMILVGEAHTNLLDILGRSSLATLTNGLTAVLQNIPLSFPNLKYIGLTEKPIKSEGARMTAYFMDPGYKAVIGRDHQGVDIGGCSGQKIYAGSRGEVVIVGWDPAGFGNYVVIFNGVDTNKNKVFTIYAHMLSPSRVAVGRMVDSSTILGYVGNTGFSKGAHLHYEVQVIHPDGEGDGAVDPFSMGFKGDEWYPQ